MGILGTATVIRGKGACELFVNGIRDEEVRRINELHTKEMEIVMNELKKTKDRVRMMPIDSYKRSRFASKMIDLRLGNVGRPSPFQKFKETVVFVWACIWVAGCKLGLCGYWDDEENKEFRRELSRRRK